MNIGLKVLQRNDLKEFKDLINIFQDVFEMGYYHQPSDLHLVYLLRKETFFAVVAKLDNMIIGGLTVYVLDQYYSPKPLAYIYDLAVSRDHQRKGIGKNLIAFTNEYCKGKGFEEIFVQADKIDNYAIDFYRATQPTNEEDVIHFSYRLT